MVGSFEMSVSFVVVSHNRKDDLVKCLRSIYETAGISYEVIVVDNASTDGSVAVVELFFPQVKLIKSSRNLGPSWGRNKAVKISHCRYSAFIDSDAEITPDWGKNCMTSLDSNRSAGICASTIISCKDGKITNFPGGMLDILGIARNVEDYQRCKDDTGHGRQIFWAHGCAMMVRRDIFTKIGGFDDQMFVYGEEVDLSWRFLNIGYNTIYEPLAVAYHRERGTSETGMFRFQFFGKRHRLRMLIKNLPLKALIVVAPTVVLLYLIEAMYWLVFAPKNKKMLLEIVKALLWNIKVLPNTLQQRNQIQKQKIIEDKRLYSILSRKPFLVYGIKSFMKRTC